MRTLRDAAALLAAARSLDDLVPLAAALGFTEPALPLDGETRRGLGFEARVLAARVSCGPGALRLLTLDAHPDLPLQETLQHVAARLARNAPHALWLVVATQSGAQGVGIAAWSGDRTPPRMAALVADRRRILDSDAEAVRALAAAGGERHDVLVHARWVEILGRDALSRRFYRHLERAVADLADSSRAGTATQRNEIALLITSRLLFLAFVQAMGWLDGDRDYLARRFEQCIATGGGFHRRVLLPLFFGTLNTPVSRRAAAARALGRIPFLNGGLFSRTPVERSLRHLLFSDDALGAITSDLFARYRFTAREESTEWAEAAIDPEMLGHTFETLMSADHRRDAGAFFTPQPIVARIVDGALGRVLTKSIGTGGARRLLEGDAPLTVGERESALRAIGELTVLDPSCGSGAFLVHTLERLAALRKRAGDDRPVATVRRDVLARSIFGVDRDPTAVWLCELRLWLSVVIESGDADPLAVPPLPNLDRNVRVGDTLAGPAFDDAAPSLERGGMRSGGNALGLLRARYARASGARKRTLARALDAAERKQALVVLDRRLARLDAERRDALAAARARDLFGTRRGLSPELRNQLANVRREVSAIRRERNAITRGAALPLSFPVHFADVAEAGGFHAVVGNPPWVRLHRIPADERRRLRERFEVMRAPAWREGAANARAGAGFGGQADLAALFVERSIRLVRPGGSIALLVPVKLWQSLAGGGVRRLLHARTDVVALEDRRDAGAAFDAVVYPSVIVAERSATERATNDSGVVTLARVSAKGVVRWRTTASRIPLDASADSPWLLVPRVVRDAFDLVRAAGVPLHASTLGPATLGVKCGCNDAFILPPTECESLPREMLRPVLRGSGVRAWRVVPDQARLLWTHDDRGAPLRDVPDVVRQRLGPWRSALLRRADLRRSPRGSSATKSIPWWTLFRTDAAECSRPRVVWADLGREPRALVLAAGDRTVPINTCYVARARDDASAFALAALLNSPLSAAWLSLVAEPARGGHFRFLAWTMALLPVPADWARAVSILAPMGERAQAGAHPSRESLLDAVLEAYALRRRDVAPLLAWAWRGD